MIKLPRSVLFACNLNSVRSAMAENILKHLHGSSMYVDSAGVHAADVDLFVIEVMKEKDINMTNHRPKRLADLRDSYFDTIISLSPEAQHVAVEMTRNMSCDLEYWPTFDATFVQGSREQIVSAYRQARDLIWKRILDRFGKSSDV